MRAAGARYAETKITTVDVAHGYASFGGCYSLVPLAGSNRKVSSGYSLMAAPGLN